MKKLLAVLCFLLATVLFSAARPSIARETSNVGLFDNARMTGVMSFNLRLEGDEGDRAWPKRRPVVARIINAYRPVFVGTQEGKTAQLEGLQSDLPGYSYVGVSRRGNKEDEYSALFYDTRRAKMIRHGDLWLSETPEVPASMLPASGHPRMVTWGEFRVDGSIRPTYAFNTHTAEQPELSQKQIAILLELIKGLVAPGDEIVVTGDFNVRRSDEAIAAFTKAGFQDAFALAKHRSGPDYSFHGWKGDQVSSVREAKERSGRVIDWIFYRRGGAKPAEPLLMEILTDHEGGVFASDHYPVLLSTLGRPRATTGATSLNAGAKVAPDTLLEVASSLTNDGDRGLTPAMLVVDGRTADTRWLPLDAGARKAVTFDKRLFAPGRHTLAVNDSTPRVLEVTPAAAALSVTSLSAPFSTTPRARASILATVRNAGGALGETEVKLLVDGKKIASQRVTLAPGKMGDVEFTHVFAGAGAYKVEVGARVAEVNVAMPLGEGWLLSKGDDSAWSAPDFDASTWPVVSVPSPWEKTSGYLDNNVFGWYRMSVLVPAEWKGRPLRVLLGTIDDADESFFEGRKIGQSGGLPGDTGGYKSAALAVRSYTVAPELVRYGEKNVIAIRVYDTLGDGGITNGPLGILPLSR